MEKIMKPIATVLPLLDVPKKIFITTHHKPDGDAIGSSLGLQHFLMSRGHQVSTILPSAAPDFLTWMPGADTLINFENDPKKALSALDEADLVFCLDFNDYSRTKGLETFLADNSAPKVLIDHHMFPKAYFEYGISQPDKSSTCEMVYDFIVLSGGKEDISNAAATCLYTGVMTDTGSFRFSATTASVHEMVAQLKRLGLDHSPIHEAVNDSWSADRMKFVGFMLMERMEIFPEYKTGLVTISRKDLKRFNLNMGDTEGLVNYPLSVSGIRFATLITERADEVKLSFRSKGDFDVNNFARTYFNGGGHFNASGGRSEENLTDTTEKFKKILPEIHPL